MKWIDFIQTGIFTTLITIFITIATCIISAVHEHKKMKIDNFDKIYGCIVDFTQKRAEILEKCNGLIKAIAENIPKDEKEIHENQWENLFRDTYDGINKLLSEYSKCLEMFLSFSHYLYRNKPIAPIVIAECWSLLNLYAQFVSIQTDNGYDIRYEQIITLVQFIKVNGKRKDKKRLRLFLNRVVR